MVQCIQKSNHKMNALLGQCLWTHTDCLVRFWYHMTYLECRPVMWRSWLSQHQRARCGTVWLTGGSYIHPVSSSSPSSYHSSFMEIRFSEWTDTHRRRGGVLNSAEAWKTTEENGWRTPSAGQTVTISQSYKTTTVYLSKINVNLI